MDDTINSSLVESLDEFDEACTMKQTYCSTMTVDEYEQQANEETDKALQDLVNYLEKNPEAYTSVIRKKKVEEMENNGIFSFLRVKMMTFLHGEQYPACLVAPEEAQNQLNQLKRGMKRAFQYSQENQATRRSARLAARRPLHDASPRLNRTRENSRQVSKVKNINKTKISRAPSPAVPVAKIPPNPPPLVPPPPPPPPPPPLPQLRTLTQIKSPTDPSQKPRKHIPSPLASEGSDHEFVTPPSDIRPPRRHKRTVSNGSITSQTSVSSLSDIHSELVSSNPLKRLRSTHSMRSPGGTPIRAQAEKEHLSHSEPLHKALISVMKRKFRNIRTPSPQSAGHSRMNSPNNSSALGSSLTFSP